MSVNESSRTYNLHIANAQLEDEAEFECQTSATGVGSASSSSSSITSVLSSSSTKQPIRAAANLHLIGKCALHSLHFLSLHWILLNLFSFFKFSVFSWEIANERIRGSFCSWCTWITMLNIQLDVLRTEGNKVVRLQKRGKFYWLCQFSSRPRKLLLLYKRL